MKQMNQMHFSQSIIFKMQECPKNVLLVFLLDFYYAWDVCFFSFFFLPSTCTGSFCDHFNSVLHLVFQECGGGFRFLYKNSMSQVYLNIFSVNKKWCVVCPLDFYDSYLITESPELLPFSSYYSLRILVSSATLKVCFVFETVNVIFSLKDKYVKFSFWKRALES